MINIVIEGTDGSGKNTQAVKLVQALSSYLLVEYDSFHLLHKSYPRHGEFAGQPVDAYLDGRYGSDPKEINPYFASLLYAYDRADDFMLNLEKVQHEDGVCVFDRYTTSNIVHQATKCENPIEADRIIRWIEDLEYNKLHLPKPDLVFFLNVPPEISAKLRKDRDKADIHESDLDYLAKCQSRALLIAKLLGWEIIECTAFGDMRSIDDIHNEMMSIVKIKIATIEANKESQGAKCLRAITEALGVPEELL
jgi:dTMP kinase